MLLLWVRHEGFPFEQGAHLCRDGLPFAYRCRSRFEQAKQTTGSTTFEEMQAPIHGIGWQRKASLRERLSTRTQMLSSRREIEETHGIGPMQIEEPLQPVSSISHGADRI